jgi:hypothetical protein
MHCFPFIKNNLLMCIERKKIAVYYGNQTLPIKGRVLNVEFYGVCSKEFRIVNMDVIPDLLGE